MADDPAYHFPPDVFSAVVDAVPLLTRSKREVVLFFQGCGVDRKYLSVIQRRIDTDKGYSKYHTTRDVLTYVNEVGDARLGQRRQVMKRITEWDDFSSCYPDNQLKAQGAVALVRQLVNKKDSFTRIQQQHDEELRKHRDAKNAELSAAAEKRRQLQAVRF